MNNIYMKYTFLILYNIKVFFRWKNVFKNIFIFGIILFKSCKLIYLVKLLKYNKWFKGENILLKPANFDEIEISRCPEGVNTRSNLTVTLKRVFSKGMHFDIYLSLPFSVGTNEIVCKEILIQIKFFSKYREPYIYIVVSICAACITKGLFI